MGQHGSNKHRPSRRNQVCIFEGNTGGSTNTITVQLRMSRIKSDTTWDDESFGFVTFHDGPMYTVSGVDGNSFIRRGIETSVDDDHVRVTQIMGAEDLVADKQLHMHMYGPNEASSAYGRRIWASKYLYMTR